MQASLHSLANISGETRSDSNIILNGDAEESLRLLIYEAASKSSKLTPSVSIFFLQNFLIICMFCCSMVLFLIKFCDSHCYKFKLIIHHISASNKQVAISWVLCKTCIFCFSQGRIFSFLLVVRNYQFFIIEIKLVQLAGTFPISSSTRFTSSTGSKNLSPQFFSHLLGARHEILKTSQIIISKVEWFS